jgi:hypothetical protein
LGYSGCSGTGSFYGYADLDGGLDLSAEGGMGELHAGRRTLSVARPCSGTGSHEWPALVPEQLQQPLQPPSQRFSTSTYTSTKPPLPRRQQQPHSSLHLSSTF